MWRADDDGCGGWGAHDASMWVRVVHPSSTTRRGGGKSVGESIHRDSQLLELIDLLLTRACNGGAQLHGVTRATICGILRNLTVIPNEASPQTDETCDAWIFGGVDAAMLIVRPSAATQAGLCPVPHGGFAPRPYQGQCPWTLACIATASPRRCDAAG